MFHFMLEAGFLAEPYSCRSSQPACPGTPYLSFPSAEIIGSFMPLGSGFCVGFRDPNSGPHTYTKSTISTEPSPAPLCSFLRETSLPPLEAFLHQGLLSLGFPSALSHCAELFAQTLTSSRTSLRTLAKMWPPRSRPSTPRT